MTIYFDMDGTIADLYGVTGWLENLRAEDTRPYDEALPLLNMQVLARRLNKIQKMGYKIGIISWLSKNATKEYEEAVTKAKIKWLVKHLHSVTFDEIIIAPYGTPKETYGTELDILFDDEERNRKNWCGTAYNVNNILKVLASL